jgi:hypothetical protein
MFNTTTKEKKLKIIKKVAAISMSVLIGSSFLASNLEAKMYDENDPVWDKVYLI